MDNLRVLLLIVAISLFAAVYLWTVISARRKRRMMNRRTPQWNQPPEPVFEPLQDAVHTQQDDLDDIGDLHITRQDEIDPVEDDLADEPVINDDREEEILPGTQTSFLFDDVQDEPGGAEQSDAEPVASAREGEEQILMIGLTPASTETFDGDRAMKALRETGLRHGDMNIYHHQGVGQMQDGSPLFSLASMFEPGSFDPQSLPASLATRGYVLFMRASGEHDDRASLELMLNTANRLAQELDGQVLDRARKPLDSRTIEAMRQQLEHA